MSEEKVVVKTPQVFANAAIPYCAFNLRDPYYREMAELVVAEVKQVAKAIGMPLRQVVDLGAGIGISTMVMRRRLDDAKILAVEPEDSMRYVLGLNFMSDPRVEVWSQKAQELGLILDLGDDVLSQTAIMRPLVDAVLCCQMFHLLKDQIDVNLAAIGAVLKNGGVLALDLGPSNWEFTTKLADHCSGKKPAVDEIMTELAHPIYQEAHRVVLQEVRMKYPEKFKGDSLWPPAAKRLGREELVSVLERNGFRLVRITEIMVPVDGRRIVDFVRNGWAVFFRWAGNELPIGEKTALMEPALWEIMKSPNYQDWCSVTAYHPTAIITAVKR